MIINKLIKKKVMNKESRKELLNGSKNDFISDAYKYFLWLNNLSNTVLGVQYQNFAKLIEEENNGRYMNSQMTKYFHALDESIADAQSNDAMWFESFFDMSELALIPASELKEDYQEMIENNLLTIKFLKND